MSRWFGTAPRRFFAEASNGWAALGACSVAGIGMRDIGFQLLVELAAIDPGEGTIAFREQQ